jgi:hypothetical protein
MSEIVLSDSFEVPREFSTPDFFIRPLLFGDVDADYAAVMSSIDIIKSTRGGANWPDPAMTHEQDHRDLGWHDMEFENRSSFAYVALSSNKEEYLGCFYFYPPGTRGEKSENADVDVSFWVTQNAYDKGYYPKLYGAIKAFLKQWPWKNVSFTNEVIPE